MYGMMEQFYERYAAVEDTLFHLVRGIVKGKSEAQQVMQNVASAGIAQFGGLAQKEHFPIWISGIAAKEAHAYRKQQAGNAQTEEPGKGTKDAIAQVASAIRSLPPLEQQILYLHYHCGMACNEIARVMHQTPVAVKVQLKRACRTLQRL